MSDKKRKLFVRITCFVLALIMLLGFVIQVAFAEDCPYTALDGFEFTETADGWKPVKTGDKTVISLTNIPDDFSQDLISLLWANLETNEVGVVEFLKYNGYTATLDIPDGYYLIYNNDNCWADDNGRPYAVNAFETVYFYQGDLTKFQPGYFDLDYITADNVIFMPLTLNEDRPGYTPVGANEVYHRKQDGLQYPFDEIYNWDILVERAYTIDYDKSAEEGRIVYLDETESEENSFVPVQQNIVRDNENIATNNSSTNTHSVVTNGNLSQSGNGLTFISDEPQSNITSSNNSSPDDSENNTATTPTKNQDDKSENENKDLVEEFFVAIDDKTGLNLSKEEESPMDSLKQIFSLRSLLYIVVFIILFYFYLKEKNKNAKMLKEQLENDKYDDTRIE